MDTRVITDFVMAALLVLAGAFIGAGLSKASAEAEARADLREAMSYAQSTADDRHAFTQCLLEQWERQEERLP